ncbi:MULTISPECIES: FadR/GntR family transcriptional regulator [unclassified Microbacterium]|uniref:FadR/GntR family transcriptional regulator n=1 Tax=unclassified Microbacterium TaxID=2609290 RepID=UPI0012FB2BBD|nr:FCD domain-containing protein [Microbacterium sp. MAH-37]MVQ43391.1 FCD domain-containing protein [Microbacterium sp. MAH-37]
MTITNAAAAVQVARALEQEITSSGWKPGHFVGRRQELAARFTVAPATLSEAIQLLRSRGVVDAKPGPGGGIFVAARSPFMQLSDQLLQLREEKTTVANCLRVLDALDGTVLHDAVEFASEGDIADVRERAARLEAEWDTPQAAAAIWALHARIARITPNELLRSLYTNLVDYIIAEELEGATAPSTPERLRTHLDFAEAVVGRDHALAASAVERHRGAAWVAQHPS